MPRRFFILNAPGNLPDQVTLDQFEDSPSSLYLFKSNERIWDSIGSAHGFWSEQALSLYSDAVSSESPFANQYQSARSANLWCRPYSGNPSPQRFFRRYGDMPLYAFPTSYSSWTLECWIKASNASFDAQPIIGPNYSFLSLTGWGAQYSFYDFLRLGISKSASGTINWTTQIGPSITGPLYTLMSGHYKEVPLSSITSWNHVAVRYRSSDDVLDLFLNGVLADSITALTSKIGSWTLWAGDMALLNPIVNAADFYVARLAFYEKALDASRIALRYASAQ